MKGMDTKGRCPGDQSDVPLSELFGYVTDLRTITSGRAAASLTFSHYEQVPISLLKEIIAKVKGE